MRRVAFRVLVAVLAAGLLIAGLAGAYSYGQSYSQHRGFVRLARFKRAGSGRLLNVNFYSPALHRRAFYLVYLPPGYNPSRRYPTFYLLHGMPGRPQAYVAIGNIDVRLDNQLSIGLLRPMILVFPDGRINGNTYSDSEWANSPAGNYDSFVVDVVHDVDHRFAAIPNREARVIGGLSAGAYGAINVALHHVAIFASLEVWSGYFTQTRAGVFAHASQAMIRDNSPLDYVSRLRHVLAIDPLRAFMFVGRRDPASRQIVPMARGLKAAGGHVRYAIYPGGHDWGEWYPRLNQMLILASQDVTHPLRPRIRLRTRGPRHHHVRPPRHLPAVSVPRPSAAPPRSHAEPGQQNLILGLLLALVSAAAINLGFLLQQRGLRALPASRRAPILAAFRSRLWLSGQAIGWLGMGAQIVAVAIAPLSLVQAFAVGGLAFSVPLAAGIFGHSVSRRQGLSVLLIALALASLSIGLPRSHDQVHTGMLIAFVGVAALIALGLSLKPRAELRAITAGILYGLTDAAIKAVAVDWHLHGGSALLSGWTALALVATFGGFLAFQSALRTGSAVSAISIMTALTTLTALGFGVLSFGESLGNTPGVVAMHTLAILVALACMPLLVRAQREIAEGPAPGSTAASGGWLRRPQSAMARRVLRVLTLTGATLGTLAILLLSLLAGFGLLYRLRGLHWASTGAPIGDSLPLLQLAGFASQPVARVIVAWLLAGMIFGLALIRVRPLRRSLLAITVGTLLILFASDAAFALARNLRLSDVLLNRVPGDGARWEGLAFAVGCWLPHPIRARRWARDLSLVSSRLGSMFEQLAARTVGR